MSEKVFTVLRWIGIIYLVLFFLLLTIGGPVGLTWVAVDMFIEGEILFGIIVSFLTPCMYGISIFLWVIAIQYVKN